MKMSKTLGFNAVHNLRFFSNLEIRHKIMIIDNVAASFDITPDDAFSEIFGEYADPIVSYFADSHRNVRGIVINLYSLYVKTQHKNRRAKK